MPRGRDIEGDGKQIAGHRRMGCRIKATIKQGLHWTTWYGRRKTPGRQEYSGRLERA